MRYVLYISVAVLGTMSLIYFAHLTPLSITRGLFLGLMAVILTIWAEELRSSGN